MVQRVSLLFSWWGQGGDMARAWEGGTHNAVAVDENFIRIRRQRRKRGPSMCF